MRAQSTHLTKLQKETFVELAQLLQTKCEESVMLSEKDFENDGHEAEILFRVGPISQEQLKRNLDLPIHDGEGLERTMFLHATETI